MKVTCGFDFCFCLHHHCTCIAVFTSSFHCLCFSYHFPLLCKSIFCPILSHLIVGHSTANYKTVYIFFMWTLWRNLSLSVANSIGSAYNRIQNSLHNETFPLSVSLTWTIRCFFYYSDAESSSVFIICLTLSRCYVALDYTKIYDVFFVNPWIRRTRNLCRHEKKRL